MTRLAVFMKLKRINGKQHIFYKCFLIKKFANTYLAYFFLTITITVRKFNAFDVIVAQHRQQLIKTPKYVPKFYRFNASTCPINI